MNIRPIVNEQLFYPPAHVAHAALPHQPLESPIEKHIDLGTLGTGAFENAAS